MPVISVKRQEDLEFRRQKWEDLEFEVNLGHT
jgi:hypothetical protein